MIRQTVVILDNKHTEYKISQRRAFHKCKVLVCGHQDVTLGGIFELTDIVWHNGVSPRCANGAHYVVEMSVTIAEKINRMRFDSSIHSLILFHSLFCLKAWKDAGEWVKRIISFFSSIEIYWNSAPLRVPIKGTFVINMYATDVFKAALLFLRGWPIMVIVNAVDLIVKW